MAQPPIASLLLAAMAPVLDRMLSRLRRQRDVVLVDQFIDRTRQRPTTFFGDGLVAHVAFADPVCPELRDLLGRALGESEATDVSGAVTLSPALRRALDAGEMTMSIVTDQVPNGVQVGRLVVRRR